MIFWLLAILLGCIAGVLTPAAWWALFRLGEWLSQWLDKQPDRISLAYAVVVPALSAMVVFVLMVGFRGFRSADGFTYFISDLHFQDGRRKIRYSLLHGLSALVLLLGQAIIGLEAFCIEFLSALGSRLGSLFKLSGNKVRTLAACGATASIAALLGQPAAAFLFVIELLYGWGSLSFTVGAYAVTAFVAASVSQSLTSPSGLFSSLFGTDAGLSLAIRSDSFDLSVQTALICILVVSISAGVLSAFHIWLHKKTDRELHEFFETRRSTDVSAGAFLLRLAIWSGLTAFSLYYFPSALGVGVQLLHDSLSQGYLLKIALLALLLRILLGALAYAVIGSVGLIMPSLVVGGLLGACISLALKDVIPMSSSTVALLGMGAFLSAAFGTPVAATALVFGYASGLMTDSALFLFTALLTNFLAHWICGYFQSDRLTSMGLYRHGIRFRSGMCFNTLSGIQVRDAMITYANPVPESSSLGEAYKKIMESKFSKLPVVDLEGKMKGMVSLSDFYGLDAWKRLGEQSQVHSLVGVEEMLKPVMIKVAPDMNLENALQKMTDEELIPVVEEGDKYIGLLLRSDLVNLYNKEVVKKAFRR